MSKIGYIVAGVSGAGKSTFIKPLLEEYPGKTVKVFSLDDCRISLFKSVTKYLDLSDEEMTYAKAFEYANTNPKQFDSWVNEQWATALKADVVVVDNTNLTVKSRARWIQDMKAKNFKVVGVQVNVPLQVAIDRQKTRGDKCVPENVVRDMYMRQQEFFVGTEVDELINVKGN